MTTIQIRNVEPLTADVLKMRAERAGLSLSEYLRTELDRLAARPTLDDVLERVHTRRPVGGRSAASILREERSRRS